MKIVTVDEMRRLEEQSAKEGISLAALMENAGLAVATRMKQLMGHIQGENILVMVGPGNNGGDGLVAARHLHDWAAQVQVYLYTNRRTEDPNLQAVIDRGIPFHIAEEDPEQKALLEMLHSADAVLDAILGTGRTRTIQGVYKSAFDLVREEKEARPELMLLALDLPSGLDANTGNIDPASPIFDFTLTLSYPKVGLFSFPGAEKVGRIEVLDIGIPPSLAKDITLELLTDEWVRNSLPKRPLHAHKGTFGRVLIIAGSQNYVGAAYLASMGAARVGAGLVTLATPHSIHPILASKLAEVTYLPLPEAETGTVDSWAAAVLKPHLSDYNAVLIGSGLGQSPSVGSFIRGFLFTTPPPDLPIVLDADALNILSQTPLWWERLTREAVLTPHAGEMSRLLQKPVSEVQGGRIDAAKSAASLWKKIVVLKGAYTVIASPDGRAMLSPFANPGLATAGTGDVLAGITAGLLGQGLSPFEASCCGVYLHALAGEEVRQELGDAGMLASDLLDKLPRIIKRLKESGAR